MFLAVASWCKSNNKPAPISPEMGEQFNPLKLKVCGVSFTTWLIINHVKLSTTTYPFIAYFNSQSANIQKITLLFPWNVFNYYSLLFSVTLLFPFSITLLFFYHSTKLHHQFFCDSHRFTTKKKPPPPRAGVTLKSILGNAERHVGTESKVLRCALRAAPWLRGRLDCWDSFMVTYNSHPIKLSNCPPIVIP